jgi:protein-S-isoprenylcysteine O-methyltransferase Ste14
MSSNPYFSTTVRIQAERNHAVTNSGPYSLVRHPGYLGAILFDFVAPLALASWWAYLPALLTSVLIIVRTKLEDSTLQRELPGYVEYSASVRYRLFPGVW